MATFGSHGLRGSTLEDMINRTNEAYRKDGLGLIQKIPTPITPVEMNRDRQITLAYFEKKSTVDYIGVVQEVAVCFDAKECAIDRFPLQNVHEHQLEFMRDFERQGGIAFFIVYYTHRDEMYYMSLMEMEKFWKRMKDGGKKSFDISEAEFTLPLTANGEYLCHYLMGLKEDILKR